MWDISLCQPCFPGKKRISIETKIPLEVTQALVMMKLTCIRACSYPPDHTGFPSPTREPGDLVYEALWLFFCPLEIHLFSF